MARPRRRNVHSNEFNLRKHNEEVRKYTPEPIDGSDFCYVPIGSHVQIQLFRKVGETEFHNPARRKIGLAQMGHTLVTDYYTFHVKVYTKYDAENHRLVVFIEDDEDGITKIAEYERPHT